MTMKRYLKVNLLFQFFHKNIAFNCEPRFKASSVSCLVCMGYSESWRTWYANCSFVKYLKRRGFLFERCGDFESELKPIWSISYI